MNASIFENNQENSKKKILSKNYGIRLILWSVSYVYLVKDNFCLYEKIKKLLGKY